MSQSSDFMAQSIRTEVNKVVDYISQDFDYRILLAPLIGSGLKDARLAMDHPGNLSTDILANKEFIVPYQLASTVLANYTPNVNTQQEFGLERLNELTNLAHRLNIFRNGSYLMVVIMSNGDDLGFNKSGMHKTASEMEKYYRAQLDQVVKLKETCKHKDLRVFSLVRHGKCTRGYAEPNYFYKRLSADMFQRSTTASDSEKQTSSQKDSYDLCQEGEKHIFSGINSTIKAVTIGNVYNFWPIARSSDPPFDTSKIRVFKNNVEIFEKGAGDENGFRYAGMKTVNLRRFPTVGDSFTGHVIELFGNAEVVYPDTMTIYTQAPLAYYGYVRLDGEPLVSSIKLTINGKSIPEKTEASSSGWKYMTEGFRSSWNIRVRGPGDDRPATPAENKTGYFLKLYGDAIFTNNEAASVQIDYQPATK